MTTILETIIEEKGESVMDYSLQSLARGYGQGDSATTRFGRRVLGVPEARTKGHRLCSGGLPLRMVRNVTGSNGKGWLENRLPVAYGAVSGS